MNNCLLNKPTKPTKLYFVGFVGGQPESKNFGLISYELA